MLDFAVWDVFTDRPFAGNPLAIVTGAEGLNTVQMQTIARQFNLSETIFVMPPRDTANAARVRIFFPTAEIPFAGHPTIGCAIYLATQNAGAEDFETRLVLEEEAGLVPVTVQRKAGVARAEFEAPVLPKPVATPALSFTEMSEALGLQRSDFGEATPGVFEGGPRFLYIPIRDKAALAKARPQEPYWSRLMQRAAVDSGYLYTWDGTGPVEARMFSPTAGIPEDPATGSAAAIFAAHLGVEGALTDLETPITIYQGMTMGRPSRLDMRVRCEAQIITAVFVAGAAVPISTGKIRVPKD